MAEFKVIVFDVERGLCVYARTPTGYGILIDCGRSSAHSPAQWIASDESPTLKKWNGYKLAYLIVTHPHDDHVEDIHTVISKMKPAILMRNKGYNWRQVLNPPDHDPSKNAASYYRWQQDYSSPVVQKPDLGLSLETYSLTPTEASVINPDSQHLLNNSSLVTILTYEPADQAGKWKVVIAGDNETAGWDAL